MTVIIIWYNDILFYMILLSKIACTNATSQCITIIFHMQITEKNVHKHQFTDKHLL